MDEKNSSLISIFNSKIKGKTAMRIADYKDGAVIYAEDSKYGNAAAVCNYYYVHGNAVEPTNPILVDAASLKFRIIK